MHIRATYNFPRYIATRVATPPVFKCSQNIIKSVITPSILSSTTVIVSELKKKIRLFNSWWIRDGNGYRVNRLAEFSSILKHQILKTESTRLLRNLTNALINNIAPRFAIESPLLLRSVKEFAINRMKNKAYTIRSTGGSLLWPPRRYIIILKAGIL